MRRRRRRGGAPVGTGAALLALALLALSLLFAGYDEPDAHHLVLDPRPAALAVGLAGALALLALAGVRLGRAARAFLALAVLVAALVALVDAVSPGLLGRRVELYWDLRHLPSLAGLLVDSAGTWRAAALLAAGAALLAALWGAVMAALAALVHALADRRLAFATAAASAALLGSLLLPADETTRPVATHAAAAIGHHATTLYRAWQIATGRDNPYSAALAAPPPAVPDFQRLTGRDVYLVFVESYGTVVLDRPDFAAALGPAFDRFEERVAHAGFALLSHRILSPTYGGGSWLAHGTVASGVELSDQFLYGLLLASGRKTLARYMEDVGYRTVAVMPGMKTPAPDDAFWGFERRLYAADLDYTGPEFGWFRIPDQVTLRRVAELAAARDGRPLFLEAVLVSSHTPFAPVPPYVADWADAGAYATVADETWRRVYAQPDWSHLERPYLESVAYDLDCLAGWLERLPGDALVILVGDHQPPAFVGGARQPWTVPIHLLSRDKALLQPFAALGYTAGVRPMQPPPSPRMADFLRDLLAATSGSVFHREDAEEGGAAAN
jgi:hypothetical protein